MPLSAAHQNSKDYIQDEINLELDRELILKSLSAAPGFFMCAIWITYNQLETIVYSGWIISFGIFLMIWAGVRYAIAYLYNKNQLDVLFAAKLIKINIIINGIIWSTALIIPLVEFKLQNSTSAVQVMTLILALSLSSMTTLSYNTRLAFIFQWSIVVPSCLYLFFLALNQNNAPALNAASILFIGILYMFQQTLEINRQAIKSLSYSLELENKNKQLKESQDLLVEESAKLHHSTRLATLGKISGELAHEINNPLSVVQGNIELTLMSIDKENLDIETFKIKLNKALISISRITKIIRGLRYFSRNNKNEPLSEININEIIEETLEFCSEKFSYNKVVVQYDNPGEHAILARPIEMSQVLLNILTNSIDALLDIPTSNRKIKITVTENENVVKIAISNSGNKIKPEVADKLFEPFFTTKNSDSGMGLGLSISKNIIESHKGILYYDSLAQDTTFVIELAKQT